ncbi:MAG: MotA/TolQ/ExbB proton channel family protein [Acidobacteria bacterium]|nr:MotA/TolQ/ExbB proton channel family protein [Acidobacteriota bacterium]MBI3657094.1 MotA/TolQ/ExbB proton channel family protein [Acidobacteriota bacterium]
MLKKLRVFGRVRKESSDFIQIFRHSNKLSEIREACDDFNRTPLASVFQAGYTELCEQIRAAGYAVGNPSPEVAPRGAKIKSLTGVERSLQRAAAAELTTLEHGINWLATIGSVTPFIGLFGTVLGIVNAFQSLGVGGTTTVQAVAPGISEALITTAGGLFAAVPAVIGYNYFVHRLRAIGAELDDFSLEFTNVIERNFT